MNRIKITETINEVNKMVKSSGWVNSRRNLGKIIFIDLRDQSGLAQVIIAPTEIDSVSLEIIDKIRHEFVLEIEGMVNKRPESQVNKEILTGGIEILAKKISILNESKTPPFEINSEEKQANEELRLKYRYLDLRHRRMKRNIIMRSKVLHSIRNFLFEKGFTEIQTPILSKSPSRLINFIPINSSK